MTELSLLERRRLEAGVLVPMIRAMQAEFGEERVNQIVGRTIREIAREQGAQTPLATVEHLARRLEKTVWAEGTLFVDVVERSDDALGFNVTRCKFVEMYEEMGARDLGFLLSCNRDFAAFEGMAPDLEFNRTQTRMQGASHCDFRYRTKTRASGDLG
jgi:predicted ArsR family transcriptional regulator